MFKLSIIISTNLNNDCLKHLPLNITGLRFLKSLKFECIDVTGYIVSKMNYENIVIENENTLGIMFCYITIRII